jgi:serine/threonine protein kinase/tetratricopeptide (TPR) repeat protein
MNPQRWQQIKTALEEAMGIEAPLREAFFAKIGTVDPELRAEVEALIASDQQAGDRFLETPAAGLEAFMELETPDSRIGERIGAFELVRELGSGGMGSVYLARRVDAEFEQQAAVKLIRDGDETAQIVARFKSERQIVARLDHPNIAKLLDGGRTSRGQPYFIMEYVPGQPVTDFCDSERLGVRARLELFLQVCDGVQHAHQNAIMHRDLKPSNILVTHVDGQRVPRIIDFGLAKVAGLAAPDEQNLTRFGNFLGTPGYMSPEQTDPTAFAIDTRTDVYSLGAILYELLTGSLPFHADTGRMPPLDVWLRRLREDDPPRASVKLAAQRPDVAAARAAVRRCSVTELRSLLKHDLDWIVLKALERDRDRRYGTPSELAADLRRYLNEEPVLARPASTIYQIGKFVRRRRLAAAVIVVICGLSLLAGTAGVVALKQRDIALMKQGAADRTARFMVSLFELADPGMNRGNSVTVREVLDRGAAQITTELEPDPAIRADLLTAMGQAYTGLGLYDSAKKLLFDARIDQQRAAIPAASRVRTLVAYGTALYLAADYVAAERSLRMAVQDARRDLGPEDPLRAEALAQLADVLVQLERYPEAERLCAEAMTAIRRRDVEGQASLARTLDTLGRAYFFSNDLKDAETTWREALVLHQRAAGARNALTAQALNNLAAAVYQSGRIDEAFGLFTGALPVYRDVYGAEHPEVAVLLHNMGDTALMLGRIDAAEPLLRQALAMLEKFKGVRHDDLVAPLNLLAMIDGYTGHIDRARAEIQRAEDIARLPHQGVLLDEVLLNKADLAIRAGHRSAAAAPLAESRRLLEATHPMDRNAGEAWRYALWDTVDAELRSANGDLPTGRIRLASALPVITVRFGKAGFNTLLARRRAAFAERKGAFAERRGDSGNPEIRADRESSS